jgi:hypothetical protein
VPFKSDAQRKWMHANHPEMAKRWEKETGDKVLPDKLGEAIDRRLKKSSKKA